MSPSSEPIAIIGAACRFPGHSDTPSKLWELIEKPRDLSQKIPASRFNVDTFYHPTSTHHGTTSVRKSYFLETDVQRFDASFFSIQPAEACSIDPQQRLLLEVVYDGLSAAGQPMEKLRGSDTAVYVGQMCDDFNGLLWRDWETIPRYTATGTARTMASNRLSYFYDWSGPSMTIDTACSSSLVAVHEAVQALRSGVSSMAVATGTNLILSPAMFIAGTNLGMLSPTGTCKMWSTDADGYARGEGVAAVILKTLSAALRDGDPIEAVIRETGVNQDGRTQGITMPSNVAQARLIRETYARAGLDPWNKLEDRPQFFHAHGTGTQAGDPQEAQAITDSLFTAGSLAEREADKLVVGSIKTVIGHTEGSAGLASLISTMMAMKRGKVAPNLHFKELNPKVAPFFKHLSIPTTVESWPSTEATNGIKRASVNSFGFGGTNSHAILESYEPQNPSTTGCGSLFTPLTFSAPTEKALKAMLSKQLDYLKAHRQTHLPDLAYTLQHRRSTFAFRTSVSGLTTENIIMALEALIGDASQSYGRFSGSPPAPPRLLGVFTGQGAQWPRMGARLIETSPFAKARVAQLDAFLQALPTEKDRPTWSIEKELLAPKGQSRLLEAALSQPLCTAVQIVLVDILQAANLSFSAVCGHSSGEIGAAYAAGLLSARDAVCVAHLRGLSAGLACCPRNSSIKGAMMAIGCDAREASELCSSPKFNGRLQVAAVNSSSSVTLSGDADAVEEAAADCKARSVFARALKVDTAYHSAHMSACAQPYLAALKRNEVKAAQPSAQQSQTVWYSSVNEGRPMTAERLSHQYWVDNMCNAVLFAGAIGAAVQAKGPFDVAIEVGPHPALKGPALSNMQQETEARSSGAGAGADGDVPYTGLLSRDQDDATAVSSSLGFLWARLGPDWVNLAGAQSLLSGEASYRPQVLTELPSYPFEHSRTYWVDSRISNHYRNRKPIHAPNPVLGTPCCEATTQGEFQWRNSLRPSEIAWLKGHTLQGQIVFPATGYVAMAIEAARVLAVQETDPNDTGAVPLGLFRVSDIDIGRAIAFADEGSAVDIIFSASVIRVAGDKVTANWACYTTATAGDAVLNAQGKVEATISAPSPSALPLPKARPTYNLAPVSDDMFYKTLAGLGYGYTAPFRGVSDILRRPGFSTGSLVDQTSTQWEDRLMAHPALLDSALQTAFAAWSTPGDNQIWSLHVPTHIDAVTINPYFSARGPGGKQAISTFDAFLRSAEHIEADVFIRTHDEAAAPFVQIEGITLKPVSPAGPRDDTTLFAHYVYDVSRPDGDKAAAGLELTGAQVVAHHDLERVAFWYVRNVAKSIPPAERKRLGLHHRRFLQWADKTVEAVSHGEHPRMPADSLKDTRASISRTMSRYEGQADFGFVESVGDALVSIIRDGAPTPPPQFSHASSILGLGRDSTAVARVVKQIAHRYPALNILDLGGAARAILAALPEHPRLTVSIGDQNVSDELRGALQTEQNAGRLFYHPVDPTSPPAVAGTYDMVIVSDALQLSVDIETALGTARRLIKAGGYLLASEITATDLVYRGLAFGTSPTWWSAASETDGPALALDQWDAALKLTGFGGVDTQTPSPGADIPYHVLVAQAVDDKVAFLRAPLLAATVAAPAEHVATETLALAVVGGLTPPVAELASNLSTILSSKLPTAKVQTHRTLDTFAQWAISSGSKKVAVLCLTDLDSPFIEDFTADKFAALGTLWTSGGTLVWVTRGSRIESPAGYAMLGMLRTIRAEYPNLHIQTLDLPATPSTAADPTTDISDAFLRHHALGGWAEAPKLMWTAEPEVFIETDGSQTIPRLVPQTEKNKRFNALRRAVVAQVDPNTDTLELEGATLRKMSPLRLADVPVAAGQKTRTIRVLYSALRAVEVAGAGFLRVCLGQDIMTGATVAALSPFATSPVTVPAQWTVPVPASASHSLVVSLTASLVADKILSLVARGTTVIAHEADLAVKAALEKAAPAKRVATVFTTTAEKSQAAAGDADSGHGYTPLHTSMPRNEIRALVPASTSVFVQFSSRSGTSESVARAVTEFLPSSSIRLPEESLLCSSLTGFAREHDDDAAAEQLSAVEQTFSRAYKVARSQAASLDASLLVTLADMSSQSSSFAPLTVVDWTASSPVPALIQPIDTGLLFRADRTYLFAGMAGELGQGLASFMIRHGARHVVLTSRNPRVDQRFIADMASSFGAVVQPMSADVTSRKSLRALQSNIRNNLPPLGGIVNGAMILQDDLFDRQTHAQFLRGLAPKITGTILLDEIMSPDPDADEPALDFFVVTSSVMAVLGNSGQSCYTAANSYMTALMANRRARGVAGSSMAMPGIAGVGYAAQGDNFDFDYFVSIKLRSIGAEDLHRQFAEAVLAGRPEQPASVSGEVVVGIDYIPAGLHVKDSHKRDIKFGHFVLPPAGGSTASGDESNVRLRVRLATAVDAEEAYDMARDAFVAQLKLILRMTDEETLDEQAALVEQGADSLVAVDVRSWFMRELDVDIPVLKILGGGSIADMIRSALEQTPALKPSADPESSTTSESVSRTSSSRGASTPATALSDDEGVRGKKMQEGSAVESVGSGKRA